MRWDFKKIRAKLPEIPGLRIVEQLGRGGMGSVYRAEDSTGRSVAVKVLSGLESSPSARARFEREAQLLARFRHPSILTIHSYGASGATPYMVCELVEGEHFDVAAEKLSIEGKLGLIEQLVEAIAAAHEAGICHRDLKPANVLVSGDRVKVIDFGISTAEDSLRLTQTGGFTGTPLYAAPERIVGSASRERGDVWSLGAMAYEVLAGTPPYPMTTLLDVSQRLLPLEATPEELEPALSRDVSAVIVRALEPAPERRFADASALLEAFRVARNSAGARRPTSAATIAFAGVGVFALVVLLVVVSHALFGTRPVAPNTLQPSLGSVVKPTSLPKLHELPSLRSRAEALEARREWKALHALLAAEAKPPPALQHSRGLAALHLADLPGARQDLGERDPLVQLEEARQDLETVSFKTNGSFAQLDEVIRVTRALDRVPPELGRRFQLTFVEFCLRLGETPDVTTVPFAILTALVDSVAELAPSYQQDLEFVRLWLTVSRHAWLAAYTNATDCLANAGALLDPSSELSLESPRCRGLWPVFALSAGRLPNEASAFEDRALAALALLKPGRRREPRAFLRRSILRQVAGRAYALSCAAERDGRGQAASVDRQRGLRVIRQLEQLKTDEERILVSLLELVSGNIQRAQAAANGITGRPARLFLDAECDLAGGRYKRARKTLSRIRLASMQRQVRLAQLHRRVLTGDLTPEVAKQRLKELPDFEARPPPVVVEWRLLPAADDVLSGGWWPGQAVKAEPQ